MSDPGGRRTTISVSLPEKASYLFCVVLYKELPLLFKSNLVVRFLEGFAQFISIKMIYLVKAL
jgi:hypothetical protein